MQNGYPLTIVTFKILKSPIESKIESSVSHVAHTLLFIRKTERKLIDFHAHHQNDDLKFSEINGKPLTKLITDKWAKWRPRRGQKLAFHIEIQNCFTCRGGANETEHDRQTERENQTTMPNFLRPNERCLSPQKPPLKFPQNVHIRPYPLQKWFSLLIVFFFGLCCLFGCFFHIFFFMRTSTEQQTTRFCSFFRVLSQLENNVFWLVRTSTTWLQNGY